jgi:hypothetical protein
MTILRLHLSLWHAPAMSFLVFDFWHWKLSKLAQLTASFDIPINDTLLRNGNFMTLVTVINKNCNGRQREDMLREVMQKNDVRFRIRAHGKELNFTGRL